MNVLLSAQPVAVAMVFSLMATPVSVLSAELEKRQPTARFSGHESDIYGLAFSKDGKLLISGSSDGTFLTATLWLGLAAWNEDPQAKEFLTFLREEKIGKQLTPYFQERLKGGGSREGTGYGVAHRSVFEILGIWKASTGEDLARRLQHPADSDLYMIHSTVPTMDSINPVGDHARDRTGRLFDYHRSYMLRAQSLIDDPRIREIAQYWLNHNSVPQMAHGFLFADDFLFNQNGTVAAAIRIDKGGKSVLNRALASTVEPLPTFTEP